MSAGDREHELEELLRRAAPEPADPASRAEARRAFLGGDPAAGDGPSRAPLADRTGRLMSGGHQDDERDGFVDWLAAVAPAEAPSAEAQRRARLAFLTAVATAAPPLRVTRPFRRLVLALAAAAILAVTFLLPEPERWSVVLDGRVRLAGEEFLPGDEPRLSAALEVPGTVETTAARARFGLGEELVLVLLPGSSLSFPPPTDLDGVSPIELGLDHGEAYVRTAPSYPGNPVVVRTALADVALHGTTVGVRVDGRGTCVCVAEGTARVTSKRLPEYTRDVGARATLFLFEDAALPPRSEAFPPDGGGPESEHTADLLEFQRGP